jgi:hypothetical protein
MRRFTIDAETVELTGEECEAFARIVARACCLEEQRRLSACLATVAWPQSRRVRDAASASVARMWR